MKSYTTASPIPTRPPKKDTKQCSKSGLPIFTTSQKLVQTHNLGMKSSAGKFRLGEETVTRLSELELACFSQLRYLVKNSMQEFAAH